MIRKVSVTVTVSGAAGSATGSGAFGILAGELLAAHIAYDDQPNTCDVTVKATEPDLTLLALTNANTDGWFFPRTGAHDTTGAALTYDATEPVPVCLPVVGYITVAVAGGDPGSVTVTLLLED